MPSLQLVQDYVLEMAVSSRVFLGYHQITRVLCSKENMRVSFDNSGN